MLELCTLASGSGGNAVLVYSKTTSLLIDAGISAKRICDSLKELNMTPQDLDGICITHSHSDHVCGLRVLSKRTQADIYATDQTLDAILPNLESNSRCLHRIHPMECFQVGDLTVQSFATSHDAPGSVGYVITNGSRKCCIVTDLGFVSEDVRGCILGCQTAVVEANHDVDWLMSGPYPYYLKQRILGNRGHLSNEDSARLCCELAQSGTQHLILAHLSQENNTPERARSVVRDTLCRQGFDHVTVTVAPRSVCSDPIEV